VKALSLADDHPGTNIEIITDVAIDPAGNVWVANNWNSI
jgi:hypothetical protein